MKHFVLLCSLIACSPAPAPLGSATLNGVASGVPVVLGEFGAWAPANETMTIALQGVSPTTQLICQLDGAVVGCIRSVETPGTVTTSWPLSKLGADNATFAVFVGGAALASWPISRTVIDEELSVCVANTDGEDDGLPLDRCKALQPFADIELPMPSGDSVIIRRAKFSLKRGRTTVERSSFISVNDGEVAAPSLVGLLMKNFELAGPGEVELRLDTRALIRVGRQFLQWPEPRARNRVFTDLDPERLPVRIRVGGQAEVSRSLQATTGQTVTAWRDESGIASLVQPLPLQLSASAPTGLTVRLSPTELGARTLWPRLTLRDSTGERTDRIPFRFEGIAASACTLEVADVNLGGVSVGETRLARFAVKNVGQASCSAARVKRAPEWVRFETRPVPSPGATVEWTALVSPTQSGALVGLIEVDGDNQEPTFADFAFRIEANVTR